MSKLKEDKIAGGLAAGMTLNDIAEKHGISVDILVSEFKKGISVEMEHTTDREVAKEIALDHLFEDPKYYTKLIDMEKGMNESAMGELDIMAKQSSNFKDFVKTFQKEFPLIKMDKEAVKWLEGIYNDRTNESVNEEESSEETLRGLKEMAMGDLERIEDYAEMIADRMEEGQELSSWMYSQITLAVDQLNSVHDAMDGKDGVKESVNEITRRSKDFFVDDNKYGIELHKLMRGKWDRDKALQYFIKLQSSTKDKYQNILYFIANALGINGRSYKNIVDLRDDIITAIGNLYKIHNESVNEAKTYKKGDKLKIKLPNGKKFNVVFDSYSRTKGVALGKFKDGSGEYDIKPFNLDTIVESVNEETYKVAGRPVTLIKGKKSNGTDWKVKFQNGKETSLSDVIALIKPFPKDIKESELKGYLAADVVDDIIKSIGSKFVSGQIKNTPNRNYIYLKLTDMKFGSGVVKMLKSQFGIDAKVDYFGGKDKFGSVPAVVFPSNKVISETESHDCGCGCGGVTEGGCNTSVTEGQLNEWRAEEVLQQLGGRKFIAMTGAKNFVKNDPKKQIVFKIGGGAKNGINYVRVTLTSMDLYNMEFLKARGTDLKVVASEKGVYNDQLQQIFTKHTGMNTKL